MSKGTNPMTWREHLRAVWQAIEKDGDQIKSLVRLYKNLDQRLKRLEELAEREDTKPLNK